ncbi:hypothetical protein AHiyo1_37050 [Arthrobacter sp. Hiyo1]|nr:hypothetical protein AHiyo1_37050 [Arthrobacter sp. Hiyo1]
MLPHPSIHHASSPRLGLPFQPGDQRSDHVHRERIYEFTQPSLADKTLKARQIGIRQQMDLGLQKDDCREPAFENGNLPQFRTQGSDLVMLESRVAAEGIADCPTDSTDRGPVMLEPVSQPCLGLLCTDPRAFTAQGLIDELAGVTHANILSQYCPFRRTRRTRPTCPARRLSPAFRCTARWCRCGRHGRRRDRQ